MAHAAQRGVVAHVGARPVRRSEAKDDLAKPAGGEITPSRYACIIRV